MADKEEKLSPSDDILRGIVTSVYQGDSRKETDVKTYESRVKEYCYYFDLAGSQKMPLFAYKASEILRDQGVSLSWDNLVIGKDESGSILRNGAVIKVPGSGGQKGKSVSIDFSKKVFHTISAGSRSGKGVMTLNFLAAAIASGKTVMYIDNKPDMASLVKNLSNGHGDLNSPPKSFIINGRNYDGRYDYYSQWASRNNFFIRENVPDWLLRTFGGTYDSLGDLFYLRALKFAVGLAIARINSESLDYRSAGLGSHDLVVVVDEVTMFEKNFRETLSTLLENHYPDKRKFDEFSVELSNAWADTEGCDDKRREKAQRNFDRLSRSFELLFNEEGAYVSAFCNSLVSDVDTIYKLNRAGIDMNSYKYTDVFILGQELLDHPLSETEVSAIDDKGGLSQRNRGLSKPLMGAIKKPNSEDWGVLTSTIMCAGGKGDIFLGYNAIDGNSYLGQSDENSKASSWLNEATKGFAYIKSFSEDVRKVVTKRATGDDSGVVYFKPYLIFNDCQYEKVPGSIGRAKEGFTEGLSERDDFADIVAENPNNDGDYLDERVGFPAYVRDIGNVDIQNVLSRSALVADDIVSRLGYVGSKSSNLPLWLQFITDLRPEWIFSMSDIVDVVCGRSPNLKKHMGYVSEVQRVASEYGLCEWITGFGGIGEVVDEPRFPINMPYEPDGFDKGKDEVIEDYRHTAVFDPPNDSEDGVDENAEIDLFGDSGAEEVPDPYVNTEATNSIIEALRVLQSAGIDVSKLNLGLSDKGTVNTGYQPAPQRVDVSDRFSDRVFSGGGTAESVIQDFDTISDLITELVLDSVGGIDMVTSLAEVGGAVAVNGNIFRSQISPSLQSSIPYEVRLKINTGSIADIFDWSVLKKCGNLEKVEFSSIKSLIYNVYESLGVNSLQKIFTALPTVDVIIVKGEVYTRRSIRSDIESSPLYEEKNYVRYAKVTRDWLKQRRNNNWHAIRNIWSNSERGLVSKVLGTGFRVGMLAVSTAAHAGSIGVEAVAKKKSRQSFLKKAGNILKEALKE